MSKLFELKTQLIATRPRSWDIHLRYARLVGRQEITLAAGTWLLEQELAQVKTEEVVEYLYRLPTGETVALDRPLSEAEAEAVADPQASTAMAAFRTLEQAAFEDWGVQMAYIDRLPPFALIKCPLCGGPNSPASILPPSGATAATHATRAGTQLAIRALWWTVVGSITTMGRHIICCPGAHL